MSSELHKHIETALENNENLLNAKVINFPNDKTIPEPIDLKVRSNYVWKLYDKSNVNEDGDQLKAVIGICFIFAALIIMGLYSNLF